MLFTYFMKGMDSIFLKLITGIKSGKLVDMVVQAFNPIIQQIESSATRSTRATL